MSKDCCYAIRNCDNNVTFFMNSSRTWVVIHMLYEGECLTLLTCEMTDRRTQFLFFVNGRVSPLVHILLHVLNYIFYLERKWESKGKVRLSCKLHNNKLTLNCVLFSHSWCLFLHNTWHLGSWTSFCLVSILREKKLLMQTSKILFNPFLLWCNYWHVNQTSNQV